MKLKVANKQYGFKRMLTTDGKILFKEDNSPICKRKIY